MLVYSVVLGENKKEFYTPHDVLCYLVQEYINPVTALTAELFCIDSDHGDREDFGKFKIFVADTDYLFD